MRIFVTGGTGFIGAHFLRAAVADGHEVIALRRPGSKPRVEVDDAVQWLDGSFSDVDFTHFGELSNSCLVHLAAYGVSPQPCEWETAFRVNVFESLSLVRKAVAAGVPRVICCGSCVEYGVSAERYEFVPPDAPLEPIGPYATSKAAQSIALAGLARELKFSLALLRPFTVFGEGQNEANFWPSLRQAALSGQDFPMTDGSQVRDFISVEEVAKRFLKVALRKDLVPGAPCIENVGTGSELTLKCFAKFWWEKWGASGQLLFGAVPLRANEIMRYVPKIS